MIGNLVKRTNKQTCEEIIIELSASCILDISANGKNSSFIYEPLRLTKQLLMIDLGCEYIERNEFDIGYEIKHKEPSKHIYIRTYFGIKDIISFTVFNHSECNKTELQFIKKIEYVHELQSIISILKD